MAHQIIVFLDYCGRLLLCSLCSKIAWDVWWETILDKSLEYVFSWYLHNLAYTWWFLFSPVTSCTSIWLSNAFWHCLRRFIWSKIDWNDIVNFEITTNFIYFVLPSALNTCLCQFNGPDLRHFLEKPIEKVGTCKIIRRILTWWSLDRDVLYHSKPEVCSGISGMNAATKKHHHLGWTR